MLDIFPETNPVNSGNTVEDGGRWGVSIETFMRVFIIGGL